MMAGSFSAQRRPLKQKSTSMKHHSWMINKMKFTSNQVPSSPFTKIKWSNQAALNNLKP
jgi:hypothetical protein